jgi:hypothetical protein
MIDLFSLAVSHGLMMLAAWRLLSRDDLDRDGEGAGNGAAPAPAPAVRKRF